MDLIEQLESLERRMQLSLNGLGCSEFSRGRRFQIESTIFALQRIIEAAKSSVSSPAQKVGTWNDDGTWNCDCAHDNHGINGHTNEHCDDCGYSRPDLGNGEKPACAEQEGSRAEQVAPEAGNPDWLASTEIEVKRIAAKPSGDATWDEAWLQGALFALTIAWSERAKASATAKREAAHSEATPSLVASAHREDSLATE